MQLVRRSPYGVILIVSFVALVVAVVGSQSAGIPLQDPEGFLGPAYIRFPLLAIGLLSVAIVPMAIQRHGWRHIPSGVVRVIRSEWSWQRVMSIALGFLSFYVCYVSYRNLKNFLPVYREGVLYDGQLLEFDKWVFGGTSPAIVLHDLLGTDVAARLLSLVYLSYLPLVPITLAVVLVMSRSHAVGAWFATAVSLNWVLGALSYYLLPALGPIYVRPDHYTGLADTGVSRLQQALLGNRLEFLANPMHSEAIHGVAAFASLHVSVAFAVALFLQRAVQSKALRVIGWTFFVLTFVATLYFGWHYVADNIAGVAIGYITVSVGAWATGCSGYRQGATVPSGLVESYGGRQTA